MVVVDAEILCQPSVSVEYLGVSTAAPVDDEDLGFFDVSCYYTSSLSKSREFRSADSVSGSISRSDSGVRCSTSTQTTIIDSTRSSNVIPAIRSGSYTDIGPRRSNEDEHIRVDDLSAQLGARYNWPLPGAFYAVFDGHGGSDAAAYVKTNALADECSVDAYCGTTAITALVLGRHLVVANAGDCRAVICRKEVKQMLLTEDDEFMILGCDGIWDVMSNQEAVNIVRRELRLHNDPQQSARELVNQALCKDTDDNLTAIIVCFTSPDHRPSVPSQRPRFRCCSLSEDARKKLQSLLGSN
ncbi:hypothetical protein HAX54_003994 [Datura stramonium]|uniref:protein-serine/threonine phosphatase n=1 Tax=Datura stramonium TaxID=4076 RepID=A0ABS8WXG1_DATST|nr:hypothetical protein [Datura stramonium]